MARYVIDDATLLHLVVAGVQVNPQHQIVAPNLIRSQALSLLLEAVNRGERVSRRTAWRIAREQGWGTTYQAEYFAVSRLQADAFVTVDAAMATMAETVVPVAPLDVLSAG